MFVQLIIPYQKVVKLQDGREFSYKDYKRSAPMPIKNMVEKVLEEKVLEVVKTSVKLDKKAISYEDFNKMFE